MKKFYRKREENIWVIIFVIMLILAILGIIFGEGEGPTPYGGP